MGTQTVFGEGRASADVMLVGEQPGDQFVGPAGKLLDRALEAAGIDRSAVYVTNAVKHFKWTPAPNGKRRIHQKPDTDLPPASRITATIHPSAILRAPGDENRAVEFDRLVADLATAAEVLRE